MSREAGGVWGRSSCPESDRAKLVPCGAKLRPWIKKLRTKSAPYRAGPHYIRRGKEYGLAKSLLRAEQASPDFYAEQELRSSCPAKHSDSIAKQIMKVSSYSRKIHPEIVISLLK